MKLTKFAFAYFCLVIFSCSIFGQTSQKTATEIEDIVKVLKQSAKSLEYEALKSTHHPDEWESEEKKALIEDHAYYTLISKDAEKWCISPKGHIDITILIFKDAELASQQIAQFKKSHPGIEGQLKKSDDKSYYVEEARIYAAVIQDRKVILFRDTSSEQAKVIKLLIELW